MITITPEVLEAAGMTHADLEDARADAARSSHALIDRFVDAEALPGVYRAYGEESYDGTDRYGKLAHAEAFGNTHLDWRQGTPRRRDAPKLPAHQERAIVRLGEEVGMTGESNAHGKAVDFVLVHGSYKEAVYGRTELAANHIADQTRNHPAHKLMLMAMGIERPLTDEGHISRVRYAAGAQTEYDLVNGALEHIFGATSPGDWPVTVDENGVPYASNPGIVRAYGSIPGVTRARALSAPKVEGSRFANTADTHRFAVRFMGGVEKLIGKTVLGTTTQVYEPFQRADMLRTWGLPYGMQIEMAGYHDPDWTKPAHIAQETNSLFDQATTLVRTIREVQAQRQEIKQIIDLGK